MVLGAVLGGVAAFFLSPHSGPENREMVAKKLKELRKSLAEAEIPEKVKEIYGEVTEEGIRIYTAARKELIKKIDEVKEIDWEKYQEIVEEVVDRLKKETNITAERAAKLKDYLIAQWEKAMERSEKAGKTTKKAVKKALKK